MGEIRQLPNLLVNQIAAGEVIERPASVVKELLENALDADATRIRVIIEGGGRELIQIIDDGKGINADELVLAVSPHATSKISQAADLDCIQTLGFRGEAMASIMSISRMTVLSRTADDASAHVLEGEGATMNTPSPCAGKPGTTITVRNLFFNTPARRKFLKTDKTEFGHIANHVQRIALSHPAVGITLEHDGRTILDSHPNQSARDRILYILGKELESELLQVSNDGFGPNATMSLWGMIGSPALARSNARSQQVFLNGRWIRDKTIMHAIKEGYRGLLDPHKHPMVVLYIEMDPSQVDVNVHPAKAEVRFRDSHSIHSLVLNSIRETLLRADLTPSVEIRSTDNRGPFGNTPLQSSGLLSHHNDTHFGGGVLGGSRDDQALVEYLKRGPGVGNRGFALHDARAALDESSDDDQPSVQDSNTDTHQPISNIESQDNNQTGSTPRILQVHESYLIFEDDEGIAIVDQHALHERVMFEALKARILKGPLESQRLLTPAVVELSETQMGLLDSTQPLFEKLGIEVTTLGASSIGIHAYPSFLFERKVDPVEFLNALFERMERDGGLVPGEEAALHEVLDMMACKAAVKAGDRLAHDELIELLQWRQRVERSASCPHGRPTTVHVSLQELERQFGRR